MIDTKDKQLNEEAAQWLIRLENAERPASARQQAAFFAWLQRSPRHLQAFFETADLWRGLEDFDAPHEIDLDQLLAGRPARVAALRPAAAGRPATPDQDRQRIFRPWCRGWRGAIAATVLLASMVIGWALIDHGTHYRTATGEQRTVKLADGSVVELNTQSSIKVAYSDKERLIRLQGGEALFTVEHDSTRPFRVRTRSATVRVLGTQFNVFDCSSSTTVTVVEGAVQVLDSSTRDPMPTRLATSEAATVTAGQINKRRLDNPGAAIAWRERRLVFDNAPLEEVAAEFNRYNTVQILITQGLGRQKRITGIFSADHPQSLILFLRKEPQLVVEEHQERIVVQPANGRVP
jgi:transmembrane sensor